MLLPRMADHTTLVPIDGTLDATEAGLQVYNTTTNKVMLWDGTAWVVNESKWTNDATNTRVVLTNLSDGTTARPAGKEFVVTDSGAVGIGVASVSTALDAKLMVDEVIDFIDPIGGGSTHRTAQFISKLNPPANTTKSWRSLEATIETDPASTVNYTSGLVGFRAGAQHRGSGTVTNAMGMYLLNQNVGTGETTNLTGNRNDINVTNGVATNITNNYNLLNYTSATKSTGISTIDDIIYRASATGGLTTLYGIRMRPLGGTAAFQNIDNFYGIHFDTNMSNITGSNKWAIYNASNLPSYFNGNIGIGTSTPTEKLDVTGSIKMVDGNEGAGKLMVSDADGKASWTDAVTALGSASSKFTNDATNTRVALINLSDGTTARTAGTEFVVTDAGSVGIGVANVSTTVDAKLMVDEVINFIDPIGGGSAHRTAQFISKLNPPANTTKSWRSLEATIETDPASTVNYTSGLVGFRAGAQHRGSGTVTNAMGMYLLNQNVGTGETTNLTGNRNDINVTNGVATNITNDYNLLNYTSATKSNGISTIDDIIYRASSGGLTTLYGIRMRPLGGTAAYQTIDNFYGIHFDTNMSNITGSNKWAIYNASNLPSYFNGNVGIGTTIPTAKLQVVGLVEYTDDTAAGTAGLTAGAFYHTAGVVKVKL